MSMLNIVESFRQGRARARAELGDPEFRGQTRQNGPANSGADDEQEMLAKLSALADQLDARVKELEPAFAVCAAVLRLRNVRKWLVTQFHPDNPKHCDANESERQSLTESMQKINAAYEAIERIGAQ
jgi:hypothetical protein